MNEYALGKNGDVFPDGSGRLIKAGSKINFNLHLHRTARDASDVQIGVQAAAQRPGAEVRRVHPAHGRHQTISTFPPAQTRPQRRLFPAAEAGAALGVPAAHAQSRQGAVHGGDLSGYPRRLGAPGPARTEMLSCVSNYQFDWHITYPYADDVAPLLPAGTIIHVIAWHDNTAANKYNPNPRNWVGYGHARSTR